MRLAGFVVVAYLLSVSLVGLYLSRRQRTTEQYFLGNRGFPWWATGTLLARDAAILLGSFFMYRRHSEIAVSNAAGKATTVGLAGAMLLYLADGPRSGKPALLAALIPFGASVLLYGKQFVRAIFHKAT